MAEAAPQPKNKGSVMVVVGGWKRIGFTWIRIWISQMFIFLFPSFRIEGNRIRTDIDSNIRFLVSFSFPSC